MFKKLKVLSWNIRGLGNANKCAIIRNYVRSIRVDIVMSQETKKQEWDVFQLHLILPSYFDNQCVYLASQNSSGGCIIAWRRCYNLLNSWSTPHTISALLSDSRTGQNFLTTTVYGPQGEALKFRFIQELLQINLSNSVPWIMGGDFNLVRWLTDRPNAAPEWHLMDAFNDTITQLQLYEPPLQDRRFTWTNKHPNPNFSKIDRFFLSPSMLTAFHRILLQPGSMMTSDHVPLILLCSQQTQTRQINRLEKHWLRYEEFSNISKEAFAQSSQINVRGDPAEAFNSKIRTLHTNLRTWQQCKFSNASVYLQNCKILISFFDALEEGRNLTLLETFIRIKAKERAYELALNEELKWHHRSRCKWLSAGDRNTAYFHAIASSKAMKKTVSKIMHDGTLITTPP